MEEMRLKEIRKNERKSHIEIYSNVLLDIIMIGCVK